MRFGRGGGRWGPASSPRSWSRPRCRGRSSPWPARRASAATTPTPRTGARTPTGWSSGSTAGGAASTRPTKRPSEIHYPGLPRGFDGPFRAPALPAQRRNRPVARTARAPDSKSGGWGFESLLACHMNRAVGLRGGSNPHPRGIPRGARPLGSRGDSERSERQRGGAPMGSASRPWPRGATGWGFESLLACQIGKGRSGLGRQAVWAVGDLRAAALPPQPNGEVRRGLPRPLREESLLACQTPS